MASFVFCSCTNDAALPTVATGTAIVYASSGTVVCTGNVTTDGGAPVADCGICYQQEAGRGMLSANSPHVGSGSGQESFACSFDGQSAGTDLFKAYATGEVGTAYGDEMIFTIEGISLSTVSVSSFNVNQENGAVLCHASVTDDGGFVVIERGICYCKGTLKPTTADSKVSGGSSKGTFSCNFVNLDNGTYTYRACASNSVGAAYSPVASINIGRTLGRIMDDFVGTWDCSARR